MVFVFALQHIPLVYPSPHSLQKKTNLFYVFPMSDKESRTWNNRCFSFHRCSLLCWVFLAFVFIYISCLIGSGSCSLTLTKSTLDSGIGFPEVFAGNLFSRSELLLTLLLRRRKCLGNLHSFDTFIFKLFIMKTSTQNSPTSCNVREN